VTRGVAGDRDFGIGRKSYKEDLSRKNSVGFSFFDQIEVCKSDEIVLFPRQILIRF